MIAARFPWISYSDPWNIGFDERLGRLRSGSPRIAYYYPRPDTSTFRYRIFNMVEALAAAEPDASAAWITEDDGPAGVDAIELADVLVVCRTAYSPHIAAIIGRARAAGKRVLYDVDDFVVDNRYTHLIMETLDQTVDEPGLDFWFAYLSRLGATLRLCDGVVTTNEYLAERIRSFHDVPTHVIPNFLNGAQLDLAAGVRAAKAAAGSSPDGRIRLGYFSGTPTHRRDFAIVEPVLARLLADDPRLEVLVVGFPPQSERLAALGRRVQTLPLLDFLNLQVAIGEVEVNLVPLQDNEFTNCKSELKYFEAAVVGTVTVASPTYTFGRAITHGENGFLARAHEWYDVLRVTIDGVAELPRIADTACAAVLERYAPEAQAAALRSALFA